MARTKKNAPKTPVVNDVAEKKATTTRKAYPSREERIAMADAKIAQLEKLNAERQALIQKTEAKLNERKDALAKSEKALEGVMARRARLLSIDDAPKARGVRAKKTVEKQQYNELMEALKNSGKSMEELLAELKK